jgi:hypothetical protein
MKFIKYSTDLRLSPNSYEIKEEIIIFLKTRNEAIKIFLYYLVLKDLSLSN